MGLEMCSAGRITAMSQRLCLRAMQTQRANTLKMVAVTVVASGRHVVFYLEMQGKTKSRWVIRRQPTGPVSTEGGPDYQPRECYRVLQVSADGFWMQT